MRKLLFVLAAAALLARAAPATAQVVLQPGTRVRVTAPVTPGAQRLVGTVAAADSSGMVLALDADTRRATGRDSVWVPLHTLRRVEVSVGMSRERSKRRSIVTGGLIGGFLGAAGGLLTSGYGRDPGERDDNPFAVTGIATIGGAALGAGVGWYLGGPPAEEWRAVRWSVAARPRVGGGAQVAIRLRF
jgi:hypothetical protein